MNTVVRAIWAKVSTKWYVNIKTDICVVRKMQSPAIIRKKSEVIAGTRYCIPQQSRKVGDKTVSCFHTRMMPQVANEINRANYSFSFLSTFLNNCLAREKYLLREEILPDSID